MSNSLRFLFTIDTEWDRRQPNDGLVTVENLKALPRLHALCLEHGIRPCYLCTQEVAEDPGFRIFGERVVALGEGEIGTHLHPWTTPPHLHDQATAIRRCPFPNEYADDAFEAKLAHLRDTLVERFGPQRTYRAGRFGFVPRHAAILSRQGYRVDTSIGPTLSWAKTPGWSDNAGPDHSAYDEQPFAWQPADGPSVIEIPVTVIDLMAPWLKRLYRSGNLPRRILRRLGHRPEIAWARTFGDDWGRLERLLDAATSRRLPVVNFIMHSNEFDPACNPYFKTTEQVERLFEGLGRFFALLNRRAVTMATPAECADSLMPTRIVPV